ncbi:MAG: hypothetical protein HPY82_17830 [Gammaproteobacteria bacterium]|nr:hypothetical protein [Gammaproteobacteria bacterium]
MISYRFEKEKEIAVFLAESLSDSEALSILKSGQVKNSSQARHLAEFYWRAVDEMVKLASSNHEVCGEKNLEEWSELLFSSFRSYLKNSGYIREWEDAADNA